MTYFMGMWRENGASENLILALSMIETRDQSLDQEDYEYNTSSCISSLSTQSDIILDVVQSTANVGWKALGMVRTTDGTIDTYSYFATFCKTDGSGQYLYKFRFETGGANPFNVYVSVSQNLGAIYNNSLLKALIVEQSETEYFFLLPILKDVDFIPTGKVYTNKFFVDEDQSFLGTEMEYVSENSDYTSTTVTD